LESLGYQPGTMNNYRVLSAAMPNSKKKSKKNIQLEG
jgi:hypothetical protein